MPYDYELKTINQITVANTLGRFQTIWPILGDLSPSLLLSLEEEREEDLLDFWTFPSVAATISDLQEAINETSVKQLWHEIK